MAKTWAVTVLKTERTGDYITNRTVVYADDQIEATRLGIEALGTSNIVVQEITLFQAEPFMEDLMPS